MCMSRIWVLSRYSAKGYRLSGIDRCIATGIKRIALSAPFLAVTQPIIGGATSPKPCELKLDVDVGSPAWCAAHLQTSMSLVPTCCLARRYLAFQ
jgi:hypothetical protein